MQRVLSGELWKAVRAQARKAKHRKAAIAYVTRDLIGFKLGDVLVVDASVLAVSCGETSAPLLRTLKRKRVSLYHCAGLHAKVLLLDDFSVIGSGNMSSSSADRLVEAAVLTDHASTVAGVASLIEQLVSQSDELTIKRIDSLCKIKVVRRGGAKAGVPKIRRPNVVRLGNRTWLVGCQEFVKDPTPDEQRLIDRAVTKLQPFMGKADEEPDWLRWTGSGRFVRECREGDSIIMIWRPHNAKRPTSVFRANPVLLKQKAEHWTRFYTRDVSGPHAEISWSKFKLLLKELGYSSRIGATSERLLGSDIADAIARKWKSASKK